CCHIYGRFYVHGQIYGHFANRQPKIINFLSSGGKKWLFWFFELWLVCREKPNVPFVRLAFHTDAQRFAAWRSGEFLAQKFNRRTALEPTTKLSYEALHPPLRQTAVSGWAYLSFVSNISCLVELADILHFH